MFVPRGNYNYHPSTTRSDAKGISVRDKLASEILVKLIQMGGEKYTRETESILAVSCRAFLIADIFLKAKEMSIEELVDNSLNKRSESDFIQNFIEILGDTNVGS